ncbi:HNH endonuclease signature motif containing protein [Pseudomonas monteilii]|uniref:HNH endonuclease signature motif containing protein n=1 Tax=Pseudomonas monteilii TaxID=76759 RepID=UPI001CBAADA2|nr:HNH endonuclease signature motif containing protein [Pseudomonas monteilii]MBZ3666616.1 HNH endonuclease [Pseudomonas monteilii]MBZ3671941.1 HNH endonuclease [Pseudomonas monteilii]
MTESKLSGKGLISPAPQNPRCESVVRKDIEQLLTADQARELFKVQDGKLVNLVRRGSRAMPGMFAGSPNSDGYLRVKINNVAFRVHRVIWLITYGEWPEGQIDHVNGVRDDNRIENLRAVSVVGNQQNQHMRVDNTSGATGVCLQGSAWTAKIRVRGKRLYLGRFKSMEEAVTARKAAELLHGFHPNHGRTDSERRNGTKSLGAHRSMRSA